MAKLYRDADWLTVQCIDNKRTVKEIALEFGITTKAVLRWIHIHRIPVVLKQGAPVGTVSWNRGKRLSEEHCKKLSDSHKGLPPWNKDKQMPEEFCRKCSESHKGKAPWNKGKPQSDELKRINSMSHMGQTPWNKGGSMSESARKKMSERAKTHKNRLGKPHSDETKRKLSAYRGPKASGWRGGISFYPYCEKFDKACRERVRDEFGHRCLNCGLPEFENLTKTSKVRKLSVHHIYYDKQEGCNGKDMFLAPLCLKCHSKTTNGDRVQWMQDLSEKRFQYLNALREH